MCRLNMFQFADDMAILADGQNKLQQHVSQIHT